MKKFVAIIGLILMIASLIPLNAFAAQTDDENADVIWLEDGSYVVVSLTQVGSRATSTKSGTKTYTYYAADDTIQWKAALAGTFTYNGSTSSCTSSDCDITIYNSVWYIYTNMPSKSGNTAKAEVTMKRKLLGVTVQTEDLNITLTCDANGNLS